MEEMFQGKDNNMSENLKLVIMVLIKNIIVVILFIILAMFFKKWWLSLFSILFCNSIRIREEDDNGRGMD